jgi:hypothetical protein
VTSACQTFGSAESRVPEAVAVKFKHRLCGFGCGVKLGFPRIVGSTASPTSTVTSFGKQTREGLRKTKKTRIYINR